MLLLAGPPGPTILGRLLAAREARGALAEGWVCAGGGGGGMPRGGGGALRRALPPSLAIGELTGEDVDVDVGGGGGGGVCCWVWGDTTAGTAPRWP